MNWNILYRIYETLTQLVIAVCLIFMFFVSPTTYNELFEDLQVNLDIGLKAAQTGANEAIEGLKIEVKKNGNSREGLERIQRAEALNKKTDSLISYLKHVKDNLPNKAVTHKTTKALNIYTTWLNQEFKDLDVPRFGKLTKGNAHKALYDKDWFFKEKDFVHTYFANTTVAAANALLTQKQLTIKRFESEILKKMGASSYWLYVRRYVYWNLQVLPTTNTVQAGDEYMADMTTMAYAGNVKPRFSMGNTPLPVADGRSTVVWQPKKTGKQYWKAKFVFKLSGRDTCLIRQIPFWVLPKNEKH